MVKSNVVGITVTEIGEYSLSLEVDPTTCLVGNSVQFSGAFLADGSAVSAAMLKLYGDNKFVRPIQTKEDGTFNIWFTVWKSGTHTFYVEFEELLRP